MKSSLTFVCVQASRNLKAGVFPSDDTLSDEEMVSMQRLGLELEDGLPRLVLCSNCVTAKQTAAALGFHDLVVDPALNELNFGHWGGRSLKDVEPHHLAAWLQDTSCEIHGGESFLALRKRISHWWNVQNWPEGRCLIFTHANVIKMLLIELLDAPTEAIFHVDIAPLSLTKISRLGHSWKINALAIPIKKMLD